MQEAPSGKIPKIDAEKSQTGCALIAVLLDNRPYVATVQDNTTIAKK